MVAGSDVPGGHGRRATGALAQAFTAGVGGLLAEVALRRIVRVREETLCARSALRQCRRVRVGARRAPHALDGPGDVRDLAGGARQAMLETLGRRIVTELARVLFLVTHIVAGACLRATNDLQVLTLGALVGQVHITEEALAFLQERRLDAVRHAGRRVASVVDAREQPMFHTIKPLVLLADLVHDLIRQARRSRLQMVNLPRNRVHRWVRGPVPRAAPVVVHVRLAENGVLAALQLRLFLRDLQLRLRGHQRREVRQPHGALIKAVPQGRLDVHIPIEHLLHNLFVLPSPIHDRGRQHRVAESEQHVRVVASAKLTFVARGQLGYEGIGVLGDALCAVVSDQSPGPQILLPVVVPGKHPSQVDVNLGVHHLQAQLQRVDCPHRLTKRECGKEADLLRQVVFLDVPTHGDARQVSSLIDFREDLCHVRSREPPSDVHERNVGILDGHVVCVPMVIKRRCDDQLDVLLLDPFLDDHGRSVRTEQVVGLVVPHAHFLAGVPAGLLVAEVALVRAPLLNPVLGDRLDLPEEALLQLQARQVVLEGPAEVVGGAGVQEADLDFVLRDQRSRQSCRLEAPAVQGHQHVQHIPGRGRDVQEGRRPPRHLQIGFVLERHLRVLVRAGFSVHEPGLQTVEPRAERAGKGELDLGATGEGHRQGCHVGDRRLRVGPQRELIEFGERGRARLGLVQLHNGIADCGNCH
mmetsp:Transcript_135598/g.432718  ORF Transcript_135598/g.432718 Transcript_135598/m.432718 type:complete len:698 (-) Transcript_135598:295-2388(-)